MTFLPSASKLPLARECSFAWSPLAPRWPKDSRSAAAKKGDEVHAVAQAVGEERELPDDVSDDAKASADHVREYLDALPPGRRLHEVAVAYDCVTRTARWLPQKDGHRDYSSRRPEELVGTADVILIADDCVIVPDYKTGHKARMHKASESLQLRFLAMAAAKASGKHAATIAHAHVTADGIWTDGVDLDCFDLDDAEAEVLSIYDTIRGGQQTPRPGYHCHGHYCPIRAVCPATQATIEAVSSDARKHLPMVPKIESHEQAARVRVGLAMVEAASKLWKAALEEYVLAHGPIFVGNGLMFGAVETARESISIGHEHLRHICDALGDDALTKCIDVKTSKAALERAARSAYPERGKGTKVARELVNKLRTMGAVRESRFTVFQEFKPRNGTNEDGEEQ